MHTHTLIDNHTLHILDRVVLVETSTSSRGGEDSDREQKNESAKLTSTGDWFFLTGTRYQQLLCFLVHQQLTRQHFTGICRSNMEPLTCDTII